MKVLTKQKSVFSLTLFIWAILSLPHFAVAQQNRADEWIRVQSDNKEFSIEFPAKYDFYGDQDGFEITHNNNSHRLKEMRMLNSFQNKTLLSFEIYKTDSPKDVAEAFASRDERNGNKSEIKLGEAKFKQVLIKKPDFYAVRRYYASKGYIYVLTAASREGETAPIKRFLDSLILATSKAQIEPAQVNDAPIKTVLLSNLKVSTLEIEQAAPTVINPDDKSVFQKQPGEDANSTPMIIVVKPFASYTEAARQLIEKGIIRVRLTFSPNGSVTKVQFHSTLKGGLTRQAMYAAIRIRFLPAEKDGAPISATKLVEYSFDVY